MAANVHLLKPGHAASLEPMMALVASDMNRVNSVILDRMQSDIPLIPELAGHLIAGGGKRLRPMLTLACAALLAVCAEEAGNAEFEALLMETLFENLDEQEQHVRKM